MLSNIFGIVASRIQSKTSFSLIRLVCIFLQGSWNDQNMTDSIAEYDNRIYKRPPINGEE